MRPFAPEITRESGLRFVSEKFQAKRAVSRIRTEPVALAIHVLEVEVESANLDQIRTRQAPRDLHRHFGASSILQAAHHIPSPPWPIRKSTSPKWRPAPRAPSLAPSPARPNKPSNPRRKRRKSSVARSGRRESRRTLLRSSPRRPRKQVIRTTCGTISGLVVIARTSTGSTLRRQAAAM